jgi:hypothetical protein
MPEPPKGWRFTRAPVLLRLMYRLPTRNSHRAWARCSGLRLKMPPVRAKRVELAQAMAWLKSPARMWSVSSLEGGVAALAAQRASEQDRLQIQGLLA